MSVREQMDGWLRPLFYLGRNPISLIGAVLTTSSAIVLLLYWGMALVQPRAINPYSALIFVIVLPILFVLGLLLVALGVLLHRRTSKKKGLLPAAYPRIDFNNPNLRRTAGLILAATFVNFVIFSAAAYRGVSYMDSTSFCGNSCHVPMQPEYVAHASSPHVQVACIDCHAGSGASGFVQAKLAGVPRLWGAMTGNYERPIPSPPADLPSAGATCQTCHNPGQFFGGQLLVKARYANDEQNTLTYTVLMMKVGGFGPQGDVGIHGRHLDPKHPIRYAALDAERQKIVAIETTDMQGHPVEYRASGVTAQQLAQAHWHTMQCADCHNRVGHNFLLPEDAVDSALQAGAIDPALPYVKKLAVSELKANYASRADAARSIEANLENYYRSRYPNLLPGKRAAIQQAARQVALIYQDNIFPAMKITWGTYTNNLGHTNWPGCFRCHDGSHVDANGQPILNDCSTCHDILAMSERSPKILSELGIQ